MVTVSESEELRKSALEHLWMNSTDWVEMAENGGPVITMTGKGVKTVDSKGKTWIDVNGGYACVNIGYGRTEIAEAILAQMNKITYFPSGATSEPMVRLAAKLAELAPGSMDRVWPVTGGSEANEMAVKIARAYHKRNGEPQRYKIISRRNSGHGATGGVMWQGGNATYPRWEYEPAYPGMIYAPHPDYNRCELGGQTPSECAILCAQAVEELIKLHGPSTIAAFVGEPVGVFDRGVMVPGDEYWPMIREICDRYGILVIADEVVTGFGRTGKWFGSMHWDFVPDIMAMGKGIVSSYLPFAATMAKKEISDAFAGEDNMFQAVLTNGGHPVSAAAALKNIEIIERENLVQNAADIGIYFVDQLEALRNDHPIIGGVRGLGCLVVFDMVKDRSTNQGFPIEDRIGARLTEKIRDRGLHHRCPDFSVSMHPPIAIKHSEVDEIVNVLDVSLGELESEIGL